MSTIPHAIARLKANLTDHVPPPLIDRLLRDLGRSYRHRLLCPVVTTFLFLRQILHGNTAVGALRHLAGFDFTDSAYCQARARLPVAFFCRLGRAVLDCCTDGDDALPQQRWRGHRTFLVDGTGFSMPDTDELRETFGQPGNQSPGCGFPTAHLLVLFDAQAGYLLKAVPAPGATHDLRHIRTLHAQLRRGDVLVGDRAFGTYAHLALAQQRGLHLLCRVLGRRNISFRPHRRFARPRSKPNVAGLPRSRWLRRLGQQDQVVEYLKPRACPAWMSPEDFAQLPASVVVRELRYRVGKPGRRVRQVTLVSTLLDSRRYPKKALADLYERRWDVEGDLRSLKQTLHLDVLRCQSVAGVLKELAMIVTVYNLVCRVRQEAAVRQGEQPRRVSFSDALRWLQEARAGDELPRLKVNPWRPKRGEPRLRKRRPKEFGDLTKPRAQLRQALFKGKLTA